MARVKDNLQYVFIHPSWRAGWCWDQMLSVMRAWGREAYAPDGPGHGSRLHEIESVSLAEYPRVYAEFIEERNLDRVVLVGNSIGGLMVRLTMQAIPDRIVHGIWYMAFILADGECLLDACPPEYSQVVPEIHDNRFPIPPADIVRTRWMQTMTAEQQTADLERWQPQPMRSFTDKADLKRFYDDPKVQAIPKSFINGVKDMTFDWDWRWAWDPRLSGRLKKFTYAETPGGHCDFNSHPEELAAAVIDLSEYQHRGEAYAREELWRKSPRFVDSGLSRPSRNIAGGSDAPASNTHRPAPASNTHRPRPKISLA
jgi:pimeloyl-ACP methyl ester carboxylesterase